jgi:hypothetical protein
MPREDQEMLQNIMVRDDSDLKNKTKELNNN